MCQPSCMPCNQCWPFIATPFVKMALSFCMAQGKLSSGNMASLSNILTASAQASLLESFKIGQNTMNRSLQLHVWAAEDVNISALDVRHGPVLDAPGCALHLSAHEQAAALDKVLRGGLRRGGPSQHRAENQPRRSTGSQGNEMGALTSPLGRRGCTHMPTST